MKNSQLPLIITGLLLVIIALMDLFLQIRSISAVFNILIIFVFFFLYSKEKTLESTFSKMGADNKATDTVSICTSLLQFEDLIHQTLSSLKKNMLNITSLNEHISGFERGKSNHQPQLQLLQQQCHNLIEQSQHPDDNRSVFQSSMDEGDVELF